MNFPTWGTSPCLLDTLQIQQDMRDTGRMPNEYHRGVNDLPDLARKRLQFIHLVWLVLTGGVGLAALIGGTADSALLAGLVMAALPGIVGATLLHERVQADDLVGPFLVIGWTLLAMLGISATGVTLSPLTILFAIAPLTAMNLEKSGMDTSQIRQRTIPIR